MYPHHDLRHVIAFIAAVLIAVSPSSAGADDSEWRTGAASTEPASDEPESAVPRSPTVWEVSAGLAGPYPTSRFEAGVHGWRDDWLMWGLRVVAGQTYGAVDLSGDGTDDFWPGDHGPNFELQADIGLPLAWRLLPGLALLSGDPDDPTVRRETADYGDVVQLSAVSGARLSITGHRELAVPVGLRWSKRMLTPPGYAPAYDERWVQARALLFPFAGKAGVDAELVFMPYILVGVVLYAEYIPALSEVTKPRMCSRLTTGEEFCPSNYPLTIFNPRAEHAHMQAGVRLRLSFPR